MGKPNRLTSSILEILVPIYITRFIHSLKEKTYFFKTTRTTKILVLLLKAQINFETFLPTFILYEVADKTQYDSVKNTYHVLV